MTKQAYPPSITGLEGSLHPGSVLDHHLARLDADPRCETERLHLRHEALEKTVEGRPLVRADARRA